MATAAKDDKDKAEEVSPEVASRRAAGKTDYPSDEPEPTADEPEVNYDVPAAGQDPDAKQRLAKTLTAAGINLPEGLSVENPDRAGRAGAPVEPDVTTAGEKRAAAGESRLSTGPTGRTTSAPNKAKASE